MSFNLISHQPEIDKVYLYPRDPYEANYQLLVNKPENKNLKHFSDSKAYIEYSKWHGWHLKEHNPNKKRKRLIAFYDVTAHMLSNKKLNLVVNEYLSEVENWAFLLLLWHNFILLYRKMLD